MNTLLLAALLGCTTDEDEDTEPTPTEDAAGAVAVSPTLLDFGEIALQSQASADFTISNQGEGNLRVFDVQFEDDRQRPHWTLQGGLSGTLAPGTETIVTVQAHPIDITEVGARLAVVSDDPDNPSITVVLQAEVYGTPDVRLDPPDTVDFGYVTVGESASEMIHIANDGTADLSVESVSLASDGGAFEISVDASGSVVRPQSEDGMVMVRFSPTDVGGFTNALLIETNDPDNPSISVGLSGVGRRD